MGAPLCGAKMNWQFLGSVVASDIWFLVNYCLEVSHSEYKLLDDERLDGTFFGVSLAQAAS